MATKNVTNQTPSQYYPYNQTETQAAPLGPRKTIFVLATVIGCIAILWPKIFYPMMFGTSEVPIKNTYINKDIKPGGKFHRMLSINLYSMQINFGVHKGCCGMVLDHEKYANVTQSAGQSGYRKQLNLMTGEISTLMCLCECIISNLRLIARIVVTTNWAIPSNCQISCDQSKWNTNPIDMRFYSFFKCRVGNFVFNLINFLCRKNIKPKLT